MLLKTMNAIRLCFRQRRGLAEVDTLANLAIDRRRPLSGLL